MIKIYALLCAGLLLLLNDTSGMENFSIAPSKLLGYTIRNLQPSNAKSVEKQHSVSLTGIPLDIITNYIFLTYENNA